VGKGERDGGEQSEVRCEGRCVGEGSMRDSRGQARETEVERLVYNIGAGGKVTMRGWKRVDSKVSRGREKRRIPWWVRKEVWGWPGRP